MARVHYFVVLFAVMVCAACSGTPTPELIVPTVAQLPTLPDTQPPDTPLPPLTHTLPPAVTFASTETPTPAETTVATSATLSATPSATPSVTPSLTITPTPTYTPSPAPTETPTPGAVNSLLALAMQATVLPITPPAQFQPLPVSTFSAGTPLPASTVIAGTPFPASTIIAGTPVVPSSCAFPPTGSFANIYFGDTTLVAQLGCPSTSDANLATAVQTYEHGLMVYLNEQPGVIYALFSDGSFARYPDTWIEGTDPNSGGETPPTGLIEPARGFGKVWREHSNVRDGLGWAVTEETGAESRQLLFERGRLVYMPQRDQTLAIIDSPSSEMGMWRVFTGGA